MKLGAPALMYLCSGDTSMSVEIEGFEELADRLDQLGENAASVDGENTVSFDELFTSDFMRTHTEYDSIETFFERSPWTVETQDDFEHIPEDEFDRYIDDHTGFNSWDAMLSAAAREWLGRQVTLE
nr:hypothetical protein [Halococcus salifodinae]